MPDSSSNTPPRPQSAGIPGAATMRRFVLLHHLCGADSHYDLMIEVGELLATWRLPRPLERIDAAPVAAVRIGMHRRAYLDYEGPLAGGRGSVRAVDRGTCAVTIEQPGDLDLCEGETWRVDFRGERTQGMVRLRCAGPAPDDWVIERGA